MPSELCGLVDGRGGQSHRCSTLRCEDSRAMPSVRPTVGSQSSQSGAHITHCSLQDCPWAARGAHCRAQLRVRPCWQPLHRHALGWKQSLPKALSEIPRSPVH